MSVSGRLLVIMVALLLAGCGAGRNFTMPSDGALRLGATTPADATALLGQPLSKSSETVTSVETTTGPSSVFTAVKALGTYDNYVYVYIDTAGQQLIGNLSGLRPERVLRLIFWNGKLVAYNSTSSFAADKSDFDDTKVSQIERDKSHRGDVLALLGRPSGGAIYPLIAAHEGQSVIYNYMEDNLSTSERRTKFLAIYLDGADTVRDMQATNATNPLPVAPSAPAPVFVPIIVPQGR